RASSGRGGYSGRCPSVGAGRIPTAGVQGGAAVVSAPDDHFIAAPHCYVTFSGLGCVGGAGGCPTVCAGIISAAGVRIAERRIEAGPDDHFTAGPHCRVNGSGGGRTCGAVGSAIVVAGIVPAAGVNNGLPAVVVSAPDNHFIAGPDGRVKPPGIGRVGGTGGCPTIGAGVVSAAAVKKRDAAAESAPYNHLA